MKFYYGFNKVLLRFLNNALIKFTKVLIWFNKYWYPVAGFFVLFLVVTVPVAALIHWLFLQF